MPQAGKDNRRQKGAAAEEAAAIWLQGKGYRVLDRNWRCRFGELDIVAEWKGALIFIEVRSRSGAPGFGMPSESVNARKIVQVRNTAQQYVHSKRLHDSPVRFDVISILLRDDMTVDALDHIPDAF